ncbi:MaoC family dehydratase N-terminal domain-containing protein [Thermodesulfobacteriota bacterium]
MAVRNVYTQAEELMIKETEKIMDEMVGWSKVPAKMLATEESIQNMAFAVDRWNPLWRDNIYGANSRWGNMIAFPMYEERFGVRGIGSMRATPECGYQHMIYMGDDWEIFRPIRPGDSIRLWYRRPRIIDVTDTEGNGPRTFLLIESDRDYINQKDEIISRSKLYVQRSFIDGPPKPQAMPEYGFTKEELIFLDHLVRKEEIHGPNIRYWEDVNVGDEAKPIVMGPTSMADNAIVNAVAPSVGSVVHTREAFIKDVGDELGNEFLLDEETGRYHLRGGPAGRHWSDRAAQAEGEPCAFLFAVQSRFAMARAVTNWMGDDGFIRKFNWRHVTRTPVGDASVGHAKIINKRVENGEHLVDLRVWLENMRGNITEIASVTVNLLSKEVPFNWN